MRVEWRGEREKKSRELNWIVGNSYQNDARQLIHQLESQSSFYLELKKIHREKKNWRLAENQLCGMQWTLPIAMWTIIGFEWLSIVYFWRLAQTDNGDADVLAESCKLFEMCYCKMNASNSPLKWNQKSMLWMVSVHTINITEIVHLTTQFTLNIRP